MLPLCSSAAIRLIGSGKYITKAAGFFFFFTFSCRPALTASRREYLQRLSRALSRRSVCFLKVTFKIVGELGGKFEFPRKITPGSHHSFDPCQPTVIVYLFIRLAFFCEFIWPRLKSIRHPTYPRNQLLLATSERRGAGIHMRWVQSREEEVSW